MRLAELTPEQEAALDANERYVLWQIAGKGGTIRHPAARDFANDFQARKFSARTFARLAEKGLLPDSVLTGERISSD